MISYCVVTINQTDRYLPFLFDSIKNRTKNIKEVVIARPDAQENFEKEWVDAGITFKEYGFKGNRHQQSFEHAINMHRCIERPTQEYIFIGNPDIFFYSDADDLFLNLMAKYNIRFIGLSHNSAVNHAHQFFPTVYATLVKKSDLPGPDFLKGRLKESGIFYPHEIGPDFENKPPLDGQWLIPGPIPEYLDKFPKSLGLYDTGCNMWLWSQQQNWRWLAFQTTDCHSYNTMFNRGNIKIDKLPKQKLIYHNVGGSNNRDNEFEEFKRSYGEE